jgi:hypothetical protein
LKKVAKLTHYGRRSGKAYKMKVWFARIDDAVWIGSLDDERSWVRNVRAGEFDLDLGEGVDRYRATEATQAELERFGDVVRGQHPIMFRLLMATVRKTRCAFRCDPVA